MNSTEIIFQKVRQMKKDNLLTKHEQIINGVVSLLNEKQLKAGEELPSVNTAIKELGLSRMTIVKAYNELKEKGVIEARNRKGYFILNTSPNIPLRVMLMLTSFNYYHEELYNSLINNIDRERITVDIYFHHRNPLVFKTLLNHNKGKYGKYIITPFEHEDVEEALNEIEDSKLILIARKEYINNQRSYIGQDFNDALVTALEQSIESFKKYNKLNLIFSKDRHHPKGILESFKLFCKKHSISNEVFHSFETSQLQKNECYIIIEDSFLPKAVMASVEKGYKLGTDIGIVSYNDSPLKAVINEGITTISVDFAEMGRQLAHTLMKNEPVRNILPTKVIKRKSL